MGLEYTNFLIMEQKRFQIQHNGKGKYHLIDEQSLEGSMDVICGSTGALNFTSSELLIVENDKFYTGQITSKDFEEESIHKLLINDLVLKNHYCNKCLKKAKQENLNINQNGTN